MKNNRLFEIVTLRDWQRLKEGEGVDPITILTGGVAVLSQIFPNIFGGNRKRLTKADYLKLIPGAGYFSTKFRNYIQQVGPFYDVDWERDILDRTFQFVADNNQEICPNTYTFQNPPGTNPGGNGIDGWRPCYEKFLDLLRVEANTGGTSPVGITPGGYGLTLDYSTLLPIAAGALVLVMIMKKKKTSKRK